MLLQNTVYSNDLNEISNKILDWNHLINKSVLVTGATGLIGSCIIDLLMYRNMCSNDNIKVYGLGRDKGIASQRFVSFFNSDSFIFLEQDVCKTINIEDNIDYIIHGASNAHPAAYASDPVGTMMSNFFGMYNVLQLSKKNKNAHVLYISSGEVYGESDSTVIALMEDYTGYINHMEVRSCYPISKRATETLCISFSRQYNIDIKIARPCHVYGPTMTSKDSRAISTFIREVLSGNDIVMKSTGAQIRSYCYVMDAVLALMIVLLKGENGSAYNITDKESIVSISEMAHMIAAVAKKKVIVSKPSNSEKKGYTPISQVVLAGDKLEALGWEARTHLQNGIDKTINILRSVGQMT